MLISPLVFTKCVTGSVAVSKMGVALHQTRSENQRTDGLLLITNITCVDAINEQLMTVLSFTKTAQQCILRQDALLRCLGKRQNCVQ